MPSVTEARRRNLLAYIDEKHQGNRAEFGRVIGKNPNLINLALTRNADYRKNIGEKLARDIERLAGMPSGWLDSMDTKPHNDTVSFAVSTTEKSLKGNMWITVSKATAKKLQGTQPMMLMLVIQQGEDGLEANASKLRVELPA